MRRCQLHPMSSEARIWILENVHSDHLCHWFGNLLIVEAVYANEIVGAMIEDGLRPDTDFEVVGYQ